MKIQRLFFIVVRLALGGLMVYGGYQKFQKPIPKPTYMIEQVEEGKGDSLKENVQTLKIRNYIFGLKQTNYFWQLLGIFELLGGILLLSQFLSLLGAVVLLPITLHIFLFHAFLEPDDIGELVQTGGMLFANFLLIVKEYPRWKTLIWIKP